MQNTNSTIKHSAWKYGVITILEVWLSFCIATFAMGMYLTHHQEAYWLLTGVMILLYLVVIVCCIKRLVERLSIPALMLLVPIAPLAILLLVISILPILQHLQ